MISGFRRQVDRSALFLVITQRVVVILNDVSRQPIGPVFTGQEIQEESPSHLVRGDGEPFTDHTFSYVNRVPSVTGFLF